MTMQSNVEEIATLGAGCFWCVEALFAKLKGVLKVEPGYSGGTTTNPTYEDVCSGETGHAEVIQITFNPHTISFAQLLELFFQVHNPTTLNRQGPDVGTHYRSVVFYHSPLQQIIAEEQKQKFDTSGIWPNSIVTEIVPFKQFYPAEKYHYNYFDRNKMQPYCQIVIKPKVSWLQQNFTELL